ncbi:MAG: alpha/beta hydrolase [Oscillospiraceae bacterium]|nr:alpha/beta hydrolase [Oscillospiraceae bacterium]
MKAVYIVLTIISVFVFLWLIIGYASFKVSIARPKKPSEVDPNDTLRMNRKKIREKNNNYLYSLNPEDLALQTPDGLTLKAWFLRPETPSKRFVICIHGYKCNGPDECSHLLPFYRNTLKYNYLLPDLRAHGRSEGKYIGFGALDYKDINLWMNYLIERFGEDIEIILHGISMGAATAMITCCKKPPKQLKLVIEDCGYTNAYEEVCNTFREKCNGLKISDILIKLGDPFRKVFAGYRLKDADPLGGMKNAATPILFVHGSEDTFVPTKMVYELYDACPQKKKLFVVEGAVHAFSYYDAMEEYQKNIIDFLEETIGLNSYTRSSNI